MGMKVRVQYFSCPGCGMPVVLNNGVLEDVFAYGEYGEGQVEEGVEHECAE